MYTRKDLLDHLRLLKARHDGLSSETPEDLFPAWVLIVLATGDEEAAARSIFGGPNDGGIDALYTDRKHKRVWIVQGKLHKVVDEKFEPAQEVRSFADLSHRLVDGRKASSDPLFWKGIDKNFRGVGTAFSDASDLVRKSEFEVRLVLASTWKFNAELKKELIRTAPRKLPGSSSLSLFGWTDVRRLLDYYIHDIAPAVPDLVLPVRGGELREERMGSRDMSAWTVTASGSDIANLFEKAGTPLFARNVRRFLGDKTKVNTAIESTIKKDPEHFWFYNNGITITCDSAALDGQSLRLQGAQIINGQQTTRSLHAAWQLERLRSKVRQVHVAVRVVRFDRVDLEERDQIVADIVEATNHQNSVSQADLRSNDPVQIALERELAARGYRYVRKKASPAEHATERLAFLKRKITKEDVAQAVGGALYESVALRAGQSPLFDRDGYYDQIFSKNPEFILVCHHLWKAAKLAARGDTGKQAAKFMIHYRCFQDARSIVMPRAQRFVKSIEAQEPTITDSLEDALQGLYKVALLSFRTNRRIDGKRYEVKPYFQSREIDAYSRFEKTWSAEANERVRKRYERALDRLEAALSQ